jgi:hypothetical protein
MFKKKKLASLPLKRGPKAQNSTNVLSKNLNTPIPLPGQSDNSSHNTENLTQDEIQKIVNLMKNDLGSAVSTLKQWLQQDTLH